MRSRAIHDHRHRVCSQPAFRVAVDRRLAAPSVHATGWEGDGYRSGCTDRAGRRCVVGACRKCGGRVVSSGRNSDREGERERGREERESEGEREEEREREREREREKERHAPTHGQKKRLMADWPAPPAPVTAQDPDYLEAAATSTSACAASASTARRASTSRAASASAATTSLRRGARAQLLPVARWAGAGAREGSKETPRWTALRSWSRRHRLGHLDGVSTAR